MRPLADVYHVRVFGVAGVATVGRRERSAPPGQAAGAASRGRADPTLCRSYVPQRSLETVERVVARALRRYWPVMELVAVTSGDFNPSLGTCMQIDIVIVFFLVFLLDSILPGPAVAAVVARGATTGVRRTTPFIVGLVIGELAFFALAAMGLAALAAAMGSFFAIVKWIGIAYLLFVAFELWTTSPVKVSRVAPPGEGWRLLALGTLLPLGNPMTIGFYLALLPTVLDVSAVSVVAALELALIIMAVWGAVLFAYAAAADRAGRFVATPAAQKWLNRAASGAMVGAAGTIAARQ